MTPEQRDAVDAAQVANKIGIVQDVQEFRAILTDLEDQLAEAETSINEAQISLRDLIKAAGPAA